jgi:signal transduction histidine kinase
LGCNRTLLRVQDVLAQAQSSVHCVDAARIVLDCIEPDIEIEGNECEIARLFANLIENSIKYIPPEAEILISISASRSQHEATPVRLQNGVVFQIAQDL